MTDTRATALGRAQAGSRDRDHEEGTKKTAERTAKRTPAKKGPRAQAAGTKAR